VRRDALSKKTFDAAAAANAHMIVQLKDNQPSLCQTAEAACATALPVSTVQTVDEKRRNRHETRCVAVFDASPAVVGTEWEPYVAAIIQVERSVQTFQPASGLWKASMETSLYLSNRAIDASQAADAIRKHWRIENKLHYTRDVTFREDASRIRKNPGVFARIRSFAYNILRFNQSDTIAQDRYAAALGGLKFLFSMRFSIEH
jgi:predicted transposase YbfD/YdcC